METVPRPTEEDNGSIIAGVRTTSIVAISERVVMVVVIDRGE